MTSNIVEKHFSDIDSFWDYINPLGVLASAANDGRFCFRGHADARWKLTPKVFRSDVINQHKSSMLGLSTDYPGQVFFEWVLLDKFLRHCDRNGLAIPCDSMDFRLNFRLDNASKLFDRSTHNWPPRDVLPLMALCQHHGIPTRLLDVTRNPIVACYFAAVGALSSRVLPDNMAIYAFDLEVMPFWRQEFSHVNVPGNSSVNISPQAGSFILIENHGRRGDAFVENISIESIIEDSKKHYSKPAIQKITLPTKMAGMLYNICLKFNISAASIFPGYDGVAQSVLNDSLLGRGDQVYRFTGNPP